MPKKRTRKGSSYLSRLTHVDFCIESAILQCLGGIREGRKDREGCWTTQGKGYRVQRRLVQSWNFQLHPRYYARKIIFKNEIGNIIK